LRDTVLTRYDAVVVILGVNDALRLTSPARWHQHLQALLSELRSGCKPETPIVMTGIQPIRSIPLFDNLTGSVVDVHARHLNEVTEELCRTTPGVTFVPLQGHSHVDPERHRTGAQYSLWAEGIAEAVQSALPPCDLRSPKEVARAAEAESRRQRAVDSLELKYARDSPALEKLAQLAREAFATKWALITVIDGDRQWHLAIAGADFPEVPRSQSFCHTTIQTDGGLVVSDTLQDARFKNNPLVTADPKVRFYAGFPIEAPDGERIGAVCILDSEPRPRDAAWVETDFIEELAVLAQAELWRLQRALHEGDGLVGLETEDDVLDSDAR
jgi:GAF domain-containing protein